MLVEPHHSEQINWCSDEPFLLVKLSTESSLPELTDLVIVTTPLPHDDQPLVADCIQEALDKKIPVLIPIETSNEQYIRNRHPTGDMVLDGVFAIDPSNQLSWK